MLMEANDLTTDYSILTKFAISFKKYMQASYDICSSMMLWALYIPRSTCNAGTYLQILLTSKCLRYSKHELRNEISKS